MVNGDVRGQSVYWVRSEYDFEKKSARLYIQALTVTGGGAKELTVRGGWVPRVTRSAVYPTPAEAWAGWIADQEARLAHDRRRLAESEATLAAAKEAAMAATESVNVADSALPESLGAAITKATGGAHA